MTQEVRRVPLKYWHHRLEVEQASIMPSHMSSGWPRTYCVTQSLLQPPQPSSVEILGICHYTLASVSPLTFILLIIRGCGF